VQSDRPWYGEQTEGGQFRVSLSEKAPLPAARAVEYENDPNLPYEKVQARQQEMQRSRNYDDVEVIPQQTLMLAMETAEARAVGNSIQKPTIEPACQLQVQSGPDDRGQVDQNRLKGANASESFPQQKEFQSPDLRPDSPWKTNAHCRYPLCASGSTPREVVQAEEAGSGHRR
jgi:hypothetical protein